MKLLKLPEEKNERLKILALLAVAAVAVLYGLYVGVGRPLAKQKRDLLTAIQNMRRSLAEQERLVDGYAADREEDSRVLAELMAATQRHVLADRLNDYLIAAKEIVRDHARAADIDFAMREGDNRGFSPLPKSPKQKGDNRFRGYSVRVTVKCGMHELIRMLSSLEQSNPYLTVTAIAVVPQAGDPAKHNIVFDLQWPIWDKKETVAALAADYEPARRVTTNTTTMVRP